MNVVSWIRESIKFIVVGVTLSLSSMANAAITPGQMLMGSSYQDCLSILNSYITEFSNPSSYCGGNYHCEIERIENDPSYYRLNMVANPDIPGLLGYSGLLQCRHPMEITLAGIRIPEAVVGNDGNMVIPVNKPLNITVDVTSSGLDPNSKGPYRVHLDIVRWANGEMVAIRQFFKAEQFANLASGKLSTTFEVTLTSEFIGEVYISSFVDVNSDEINRSDNLNFITATATGSSGVIPEVSVSSIDLAQVVYNPQSYPSSNLEVEYSPLNPSPSDSFLAVQGKSASFSPTVKLNDSTSIPEGTYQVQIVQSSNGMIVSQSPTLSFSTLSSSNGYKIGPEMMAPPSPMKSFVPVTVGPNALVARIVSSNSNVVKKDKNLTLNVVKTYAPAIGLMRVAPSLTANQYSVPSAAAFAKFLNLSPYLSSMLPVPDKSITLTDAGTVVGNSTPGTASEINDLLELDRRRRLLQLNRVFAVVDSTYLRHVGVRSGVVGYHRPGLSYVAVGSSADLDTLAHELGHSFGVHYEIYGSNWSGTLHDGFDADPTGYFGSNQQIKSKRSFMDSAVWTSQTSAPWVDNRSYAIMFNYLSKPIIDPETILISGILEKGGKFSSVQAEEIPNGVVTQSEVDGDLVINALDASGNILSQVKQKLDFSIHVVGDSSYTGPSKIPVDSVPVAVEILDDERIATIQFIESGKEIARSSVNALKVVSIVESIPLDAFKAVGCLKQKDRPKFAQKEKDALLKIAQAAQKALDSKQPQAAKVILEALVLGIKLTTSSSYQPIDAGSISPSTAVDRIKSIIKSLDGIKPKKAGR